MFLAVEFMQIMPIVSFGSIESFHISILRWLAWLYVEERDMVFGSPVDERLSDVFRAVVTPDGCRFSRPLNQVFEASDYAF